MKINAIIIDNKVNASHQNNNNFENNIGTEDGNCIQLNDQIKKVKKAFWYGTLELESEDENFLKVQEVIQLIVQQLSVAVLWLN